MARASTTKKAAYHHGNLRRELVEKARELIRDVPIEKISLRGLAAALGVSHNAPYMHFASREELLAAIAEDGFRQLSEELAALEGPFRRRAAWAADFKRGCRVYIEFAEKNPELFRVMFMEHDAKAFPTYLQRSMDSLRFLSDALAQGQRFGHVREGSVDTLTNFAWALIHGVAVLHTGRRNDRVTVPRGDRQKLIDDCLRLALEGVAA